MAKINTDDEYRHKLNALNKRGRRSTEQASERQKQLEGETADYAQNLQKRETKGRPRKQER